MKKKVMLASLLAIGLAAGVGTQIHAQDTAYLCGGYHSHMHSAADGCLHNPPALIQLLLQLPCTA